LEKINRPTILVVEDDRAVQTVIGDALDDGGFEPAITASGEEAVTLLKGQKGRYRALLADIGLRGRMTGWEVATHARHIDPEFPVLYITGASAHQWPFRCVPHSALLTKPFAPAQLITAIANLLNTGSSQTAPA
jgi:CheY-like chemotaxis protein